MDNIFIPLLQKQLDSCFPEHSPASNLTVKLISISGIKIFSSSTSVFLYQLHFKNFKGENIEKKVLIKSKKRISSREFDRMFGIWKVNPELVPRPLFKNNQCLITEYEGQKKLLNVCLPKMLQLIWPFNLASLEEHIRKVAIWLCRYQKTLPVSQTESIVPYINAGHQQLSESHRFSKLEKQLLINKIKTLSLAASELPVVENHGDFYFRNILYNYNKLKVIDWESNPKRGNFLLDFNCFFLNILSISRFPIFSRSCCRKLQSTFKIEYLNNIQIKTSPQIFDLLYILFIIQYLNDFDKQIHKWTPRSSFLNNLFMKAVKRDLIHFAGV